MIYIISYLLLGFLISVLSRFGIDEEFPLLLYLFISFCWPGWLIALLIDFLWRTEI